jgi:two-component system chemotaxis response regulator CheB
MKCHNIIVIGTSAGGIEVLTKLLAPLKSTLPASIFIVQHVSVLSSVEVLINIIQRSTELTCKVPGHNELFRNGHVYLAPPDQHMLIREDRILLIRSTRENGFRPSVDSLFRSAAAYYGPQTIGIVLTGMLQDGTVGMEAIKRAGGMVMVQDPAEAQFSEMPQSVLQNMEVDYCLPVSELSILLQDLVFRRPTA